MRLYYVDLDVRDEGEVYHWLRRTHPAIYKELIEYIANKLQADISKADYRRYWQNKAKEITSKK